MTLYTLAKGPIDPTDVDLTPPGRRDGGFVGLVGQALSDLGGVDARLDAIAAPVVDTGGANPDSDLAPHEADLAASQATDAATLHELYTVDENAAGESVNTRQDGAFRIVDDVSRAHAALSPQIDAGAAAFAPEAIGGDEPGDRLPDPDRDGRPPKEV